MRFQTLAVADIELHLRRKIEGAGIPSGRHETKHLAFARLMDVHDSNAIVIRIRDEEHVIPDIERKAVRCTAHGSARGWANIDGLNGLPLFGVVYSDGVF